MTTTLNKIKAHSPCEDGWAKLLLSLNKTQADDDPLYIATIIESNDIKDAVWALRAVEGKDKEIRLFAADCAESVLHIYEKQYPNDDRPRKAIQAARDYANGVIGKDELAAERDAARDAARDAERDAERDAAWAAARAAAWAAERAAARDAAGGAAGGAASAAAWAAAGAAMDAKWKEIELLLTKYL